MATCCIPECTVTRRSNPDNHRFFKLPKRTEVRDKWLRIINRPNWTPKAGSTVCSRHFEDKYLLRRNCKMRLRQDAVPTLFVSVHLKPRRPASSYVFRDIITADPPLLAPAPSAGVPTTNETNLMNRIKLFEAKWKERKKQVKRLNAKNRRLIKKVEKLNKVISDLKRNSEPGCEKRVSITVLGSDDIPTVEYVDIVNGNIFSTE